MQEKIRKFKKVLEEANNWHLFHLVKDKFLEADITLKNEDNSNVVAWFQLADDYIYNNITMNFGTIDISKKYKALEFLHDLSSKYVNARYYLYPKENNRLLICRKTVYIADKDNFNPSL